VFLGLDQQLDGRPPLLWETMVFGLDGPEHQCRHASRAEALAHHSEVVADIVADGAQMMGYETSNSVHKDKP
jgi:hypothetical protein